MRSVWMFSLSLLVAALSARADSVLGGTCQDDPHWHGGAQMRAAEQRHDWPRLIALRQHEVRAGCGIAYRWYELAETLLAARRDEEALQVLDDMDRRGFEINPSLIYTGFSRVSKFLRTSRFHASALGQRVAKLEAVSDERRTHFLRQLEGMPASARPPQDYVAKQACPFECCRFGDWTVLADTDLLAAPNSTRVVGRASKDSRVQAVTGEVHLTPEPVGVLVDGPFRKGSIVFVLDSMGENFAHIYADGKIIVAEENYTGFCFQPSDVCWGETILRSARAPRVWWIQIRLANGVVGWTQESAHFGNNDACG